jgi:hypothetical protein
MQGHFLTYHEILKNRSVCFHLKIQESTKKINTFIYKRSKIAPLCISINTVNVSFFLSGVEVLGIEVSRGDSTESNVSICHDLFVNYLNIMYI